MRNFSTTFPFLFSLMLLSCNNISSNKIIEKKTDKLIVPTDSNAIYLTYPTYSESQPINKEFLNQLQKDSNDVYGVSYYLFRFKEPILRNYGGNMQIYRFTLSRSFHPPICIRLENNNGAIKLVTKALSGRGGYSIGQISIDTSISLSEEKWDTFVALVDRARFWEMPKNNYDSGFDGATWILEAVKNQEYHWVMKWSPQKHSSFAIACMYLVSISPIIIDPNTI